MHLKNQNSVKHSGQRVCLFHLPLHSCCSPPQTNVCTGRPRTHPAAFLPKLTLLVRNDLDRRGFYVDVSTRSGKNTNHREGHVIPSRRFCSPGPRMSQSEIPAIRLRHLLTQDNEHVASSSGMTGDHRHSEPHSRCLTVGWQDPGRECALERGVKQLCVCVSVSGWGASDPRRRLFVWLLLPMHWQIQASGGRPC